MNIEAITGTAPSPLVQLEPRAALSPEQITAMQEEMRNALHDALRLGYFERMEHNHDVRHNWWEGQTLDGRKWPLEDAARGSSVNRRRPGDAGDIFPWPGASDVRPHLIDQVIGERTDLMALALHRRQQRMGPRHLAPDDDPQAKAALWNQTDEYYEDLTKLKFRTAMVQASDVAEEYGHAVVGVCWKQDEQVVERQITAQDLLKVVARAVVQQAEENLRAQWESSGRPPEAFPGLDKGVTARILMDVGQKLKEMVADDKQRQALGAVLRQYDPTMPKDEAMRVAKGLRLGGPVSYYATEPFDEMPEFTVHTPFLDIIYPATAKRINESWCATVEWVDETELLSRIESEGYDEDWVAQVLTKPGRSILYTGTLSGMDKYSWVLSQGFVRCGLWNLNPQNGPQRKLFQLIHYHFRACAIGMVRAVYHTVMHGQVLDTVGLHEVIPYEHGKTPFCDVLAPAELKAPFLLAARGAGEKASTFQNEIKTQRDLRSDAASYMIQPAVTVPWNAQDKTTANIRPGRVIPIRTTQGMGGRPEALDLRIDPRGSQEVEKTTMDALNEYFHRGVLMDPVLKQTRNQTMVTNFLIQVREVKLMAFATIQQNAPDELKSAFVAGMPVDLSVTREDIQGRVSLEMDFDVGDLDPSTLKARMEAISEWLAMDTTGLVPRAPLLKAVGAFLLPSHWKLLVNNPDQQAQAETADEQNINSQILSGTQFDEGASYVVGTDHQRRLGVMQGIYGMRVDAKGNIVQMIPNGAGGQTSRAQNLYASDPDVQARVNNRVKFHARQIVQQQVNPQVGRQQVEDVGGGAGGALALPAGQAA